MPSTAEAPAPEKKPSPIEQARDQLHKVDKIKPVVDSELVGAGESPVDEEAQDLADALFGGSAVPLVAEAAAPGEAPERKVLDARQGVEDALRSKFIERMRQKAADAIADESWGGAEKRQHTRFIDDVPIERVHQILLAHGMEDFVEITDREAKKIKPFKDYVTKAGDSEEVRRRNQNINPGQMLRDHLAKQFGDVRKVYDETEAKINATINETLKKRKESTKRFGDALMQADELRHNDKAATVDFTAIMQNPEGTLQGIKELNRIVGKTKEIVAKRTYRDKESKAYLREVAYAVDVKDPVTGEKKRSDKEVVVEVWNIGRNGGNLLRSSLVKVDTVKDKEWQWKFGKGKLGILPNRHEVDEPVGIMEKKLIRNWFKPQLSEGVRNQLAAVDKSAIDASSRTTVDGGDGGGYGVTSHVGRHNAELLGYGKKKAKKIAKSPGIIEMLGARLFSNSNKISPKPAKKKR